MTDLTGGAPRRAIFIRAPYGVDGDVLAIWCGFGNIDAPANDLDLAGQRYQGLGAVAGIPDLEQSLNGEADRINLAMSAVPAELAFIAEAESDLIIGSEINIGWAKMDADWQIDGDLLWLFDGRVDTFNVSRQAGEDGNQSHSISLSVGTATTGRRRPDFDTWTDAQHQRAHPGDLFFNQVPTSEKQKRWPG